MLRRVQRTLTTSVGTARNIFFRGHPPSLTATLSPGQFDVSQMVSAETKSGLAAGLAYEETGAGCPLIFLHGLTYSRRIWKPFADALSPEFRCILVDLPDHGASPELESAADYDPRLVADEIHTLAALLAVDNPVLVGHSLGAVHGLFFAARYRCRSAVNFDQMFRFDAMASAIQPAESILRGPGFEAFWGNLRTSFRLECLPDWGRTLERQSSAPKQGAVLKYWDILLRGDPNQFQKAVEMAMGVVSPPYVAVHGHDPGVEYNTWLERHLQGCQIIVWPNSGHFPQLVHFDESVALLRRISNQ